MTENRQKNGDDAIFEGFALLAEGCSIVSYNENLTSILGKEVIESGRLCISGITNDTVCEICGNVYEKAGSGLDIYSGVRTINGTPYYVRIRRLFAGIDGHRMMTARFVHAADEDAVIINISRFMDLYVSSLETLKTLPWVLEMSRMKLINIFGNRYSAGDGPSSVDFEGWFGVVHEDDRAGCFTELRKFITGDSTTINIEYRIMNGRGGWRWIRTTGHVIKSDAMGRPLVMNGFTQDLTDLKNYEELIRFREKKLRDSESRLKNAMKLGRMSPWEYDFASDKFITDSRMSEMWGYRDYYEKNIPIGRDQLAMRIHPDERENVIGMFDEAAASSGNFEHVFRIVVDGRVRYMNFISESVIENNRPVKLIGVAQDITQFKALETNLERKYEGLKFITERAGIGLWDFSVPDMTMYIINNEYQLGQIDEHMLTMPYASLLKRVHPDDVEVSRVMFDSLVNGETDFAEMDKRFRMKKDYNWFHISAVISSRDAEGKPYSIRGLYQDITEKKEIENKLYQSQKMEAVGRLAGGVAHDFNNILQVIQGYGSLALMDAENESEMFEFISNIVDSGEKARNLVRQLLLFARREKFKPALISLNDLIGGLTMMLKRVIGENITLEFTPENGISHTYGDPGQLEQVVMNLCINARDAVAETGEGSIIIRTKDVTVDQPWPCFESTIPAGRYSTVSVTDNGTGIPPENLEKIFEPFFTTKEKHKGTGLGLATVYSIIKQHGGYIDLYSMEGNGSAFTVYLPAFSENAELSHGEDTVLNSRLYSGRGTVLMAEDDELIRKYTHKILTDSGFHVITACDGVEAVEQYQRNRDKIDLVILDVIMPRMNGWDVYNSIVSNGDNIPIVFISGYDEDLLPAEFSREKPMRYVQKPFKYYTFVEAIQELLEKK